VGKQVGIRIPSATLKSAGLSLGDQVNAEVQPDRSILLRAVERPRAKIDINALIAKITPESLPNFEELHSAPVGKEIW
jgi:antitoxin component of MazEF toxin-antitoxin module